MQDAPQDSEGRSGIERWRSKVALVTGASSGIGAAVTRKLAQEGLTVYAAARRRQRLDDLARSSGGHVIPVSVDLRDEGSIRHLFARIEEEQGGLDVLVNNAGLGHQESLLEGATERWREMLEVNVLSLCVCTREGVRLMRGRSEGHIFHLGSLSGHRNVAGSGVYGATKFAVRSLTESLRQEIVAAGLALRVTSVSPGFVETEFHEKHFKSQEKSRELYTRYRVLHASDVADQMIHALAAPAHVAIHDILVRSRHQPS